jgi:hypothetical protein
MEEGIKDRYPNSNYYGWIKILGFTYSPPLEISNPA